MKKIFWTEKAQTDLINIGFHIKKDKPVAAKKFVSEIRKRVSSLKDNPEIGRVVPEINNQQIREIIHKRYRIVYLIKKNRVNILTVFEGHKLLKLHA